MCDINTLLEAYLSISGSYLIHKIVYYIALKHTARKIGREVQQNGQEYKSEDKTEEKDSRRN